MSGSGSIVERSGHKRWSLRLLLLALGITALLVHRAASSEDEQVAGDPRAVVSERAAQVSTIGESAATHRLGVPRARALGTIVPGALRLEGLIIDQDDRPVAGARVTIGDEREVITEADGAFAFDGLAEGEYDVVAEQGEQYAEEQDARLDDTSEPVTIKLVRGPTLVVRVTDEAHHPLPGATVEAASRTNVTDADGLVMLRGVASDDEMVSVALAGHASVRERVVTSDDPAATIEKTFVLRSGAEISGTVVGPDGKPVNEAYVELEPSKGGRSETVYADEHGVWRLPDIGSGQFVARASSREHIATADVPVEHDGVHAKSGLVLHVEMGGEIAGIVVDTADHPVPEARVSASSIGETTDKDGRFVARGLGPDTYAVSASTPMLGAATTSVVLARGQHATIKIVVVPSSLAGTVVDAHGAPVEDAAVFARTDAPDGYGYDRTDAYGHFDLGGLPPGRYKVTAQREDSQVESPELIATTGSRQLRLTVPDRATIIGRVVMAGKPVPYFGLVVSDDATDTFTRPTPVRDADGRFTQKDASLGTFAVIIVGPGFARRVVENVHVTSGQVTDLGDIAVERGEAIHGRVVDEHGVGIAGARVRVSSSRSLAGTAGLTSIMRGEISVNTDDRGAFEMAGLPPGSDDRTIEATHTTRGTTGLRPLAVGETEIELVLTASGSISGTVLHATRKTSLAIATRVDDSRARYSADIDASGAFEIPLLPPGEYEVDVLGRNSLPSAHVTVVAGRSTPVTFELPEHPVELRVHIRGECGLVNLRITSSDTLLGVEVCSDGVATFHAVAPGAYQVCAESTRCRELQVPAVPVHDVDLDR